MKRTGLFYGSSSGSTERASGVIAQQLDIDKDDVFDIAKLETNRMAYLVCPGL